MPKKKRSFKRFLPYFIAFIALIAFGALYLYIAKITIETTNTRLGVEDFKITDVDIEKGSVTIDKDTFPKLSISYKTTWESNSKVIINSELISDEQTGKTFSYEFSLDKDLFGQELEVVIEAVDKSGFKIQETRNVNIEQPKTPIVNIS